MSKENSKKIVVIGAGAVGSTVAYTLMMKNLVSKIYLVDVDQNREKGEILDMDEGLSFSETGKIVRGSFRDAQKADVIIICAGCAQKPGETRLDLISKNSKILKNVFKQTGKLKSDAIVIIVSNPVDVLTMLAHKICKLPAKQIFGSGTSLDTVRLHSELAHRLEISPQSVAGFVLGEHGDSGFTAWSTVSVGGKRMEEITAKKKVLKEIEQKIRSEAYEIIKRKGATHYGIASTVTDIVEAIVYNQRRIIPVSAYLHNHWNGVSGVCLGVPAVIGANGIERIWPVRLTFNEKRLLIKSARVIKKNFKQV